MQYTQESPQDYYDRTGQMPPADPNAANGQSYVDAQGKPYIGGVSQSGPFLIVDSQHATAAHPAGSMISPTAPDIESVYKTQSPDGLMDWIAGPGTMIGLGAGLGAAAIGAGGAGAGMGEVPYATGGVAGGGSAAGGAGVLAGSGEVPYAGELAGGGASGAAGGVADAATGEVPYAAGAAGTAASTAAGGANPNTTFGIPNNVLGGVAQGVIGAVGAGAQGSAYNDVASKYLTLGAPERALLEASYKPGFSLMDQPGYGDAFTRAADIASRSYSAKMGNPADNPSAQAGILSDVWNGSYIPTLNSYRSGLNAAGNTGLPTAGAASVAGAGSVGDLANAIGAGANTALNPPTDIAALLKQMGTLGNNGSQNYSLNVGGMKA